eukprot:TRINITY_DN2826_c0_g1_i1.p1 TRINITY_DN2826_c0_g1~~TRINITY_DN2826_c0_g1_i1.p1  ORF type:complete len:779 (-),score=218.89 TRINITY_DN2826_c0_g1_i1:155-2491(-)
MLKSILLTLPFLLLVFHLTTVNSVVKFTGAKPDWNTLQAHRTSQYRVPAGNDKPIVARRGQTFAITFDTASEIPKGHSLSVHMVPKNSNYSVTLTDKSFPTYRVEIALSTICDVGEFRLQLNLLQSGKQVDRVTLTNKLFILFNPYHSGDETFFPNQQLMAEYMDNEWGTLWRGSVFNYGATRWYYGQFDYNALVAASHVLSKMTTRKNNAVDVIRYLSYELAAQEVNVKGMMHGKWAEPYTPGTDPRSWTGSNQIIDSYVKNNFKTVQYTQCWVFSGVYTSIARALGLVTRQIFTFESAHEKPDGPKRFDQNIIRIRNQNGQLVNSKWGSVWNFHSWNEVYLSRRSDGRPAGWQAADSTPQEPSEGNKYMLGPAPLALVANFKGQDDKYDVSFTRSMVAAVIENHEYSCKSTAFDTCTFRRKLQTNHAGALILAADNILSNHLDITALYKNPTVWRNFKKRQMSNMRLNADAVFHQVELGAAVSGQLVVAGEDQVEALNEQLTIRTNIEVVDYRGSVVENLKSYSTLVSKQVVAAKLKRSDMGESRRWQVIHPVELGKDEYLSKIGNNHLRFVFRIQNGNSSGDLFFFEKPVHLVKPKLHLSMVEESTGRHVCDNRFNDITYSYNSLDDSTVLFLTHHANQTGREAGDLLKNLLSDEDVIDSQRQKEEKEKERKRLEAIAFHRSPISTHRVYRLHISYQNPMSIPLTNVEIRVNPGKMTSLIPVHQLTEVIPSIGALEKIERTINLSAELTGHHSVIVTMFNHNIDVQAYLDLAASQ